LYQRCCSCCGGKERQRDTRRVSVDLTASFHCLLVSIIIVIAFSIGVCLLSFCLLTS
jgi:hypothetical protein